MSVGVVHPLIIGRMVARFDDRRQDIGESLTKTATEIRQIMENLRDLDGAQFNGAIAATLDSYRSVLDQVEGLQAHVEEYGSRVHAVVEALEIAANMVSALVGKIEPASAETPSRNNGNGRSTSGAM